MNDERMLHKNTIFLMFRMSAKIFNAFILQV